MSSSERIAKCLQACRGIEDPEQAIPAMKKALRFALTLMEADFNTRVYQQDEARAMSVAIEMMKKALKASGSRK